MEITFPGANGYISVKNTGKTGIKMTFFHTPAPDSTTTELEVLPGELAPVMGGNVIRRTEIRSFCVHPGPYVHCDKYDCPIPCCPDCGHHVEDA